MERLKRTSIHMACLAAHWESRESPGSTQQLGSRRSAPVRQSLEESTRDDLAEHCKAFSFRSTFLRVLDNARNSVSREHELRKSIAMNRRATDRCYINLNAQRRTYVGPHRKCASARKARTDQIAALRLPGWTDSGEIIGRDKLDGRYAVKCKLI